jgi:hypothetical protein
MLPKILICAVAFFGVLAGPLIAAPPPTDPASAAEWRKAEDLMLEGQATKAYPIFVNLNQRFPNHSSLRLGLARSAALTGRYDEAEAIYQDLLTKYPGDPTLLNESDQVKALKSGQAQATTFHFRARVGLVYDSNANQGANSDVSYDLNFGGFEGLLIIGDTEKISTFGAYFGADFNFSHRLGADSPWSVVGDAGLYVRGNEDSDLDDIRSSEWQWFRAGAGVRYVKGQNLFDVRLKWEVFDYELTNHVTSWGPELTYLRALTPKVHLISQLSADWRDYQRNHDRDGSYGQFGQYARFFFSERGHSLTVGAAYQWGRPRVDELGHDAWSLVSRLTVRPNESWEISPFASFTSEYYKGPAFPLERDDRRDKKFRSGIDVVYKLTESLNLEFNYSYNRDSSNSPLHDYDQHVVSSGLSWGF